MFLSPKNKKILTLKPRVEKLKKIPAVLFETCNCHKSISMNNAQQTDSAFCVFTCDKSSHCEEWHKHKTRIRLAKCPHEKTIGKDLNRHRECLSCSSWAICLHHKLHGNK